MKNTIKVTLVIAAFLASFGIVIPVLADTGSGIVDMMNDFNMGPNSSSGSDHMSGDHQMMMDGGYMDDDHMDSEHIESMMNHMSGEDCDEEMNESYDEHFNNHELNDEECLHYSEEIHEDCVGWDSED